MDLSTLNQEQRKAVTAPLGPVCVIAGPGSGKTRVLTFRIAYLVEELGINPRSILAVTFTNKAADEMRTRLKRLIGDRADEVSLGTFHSVFARLLRFEADKIGYKSNFSILDDSDQEKIVKKQIERRNLDPKRYPASRYLNAISRFKNELTTPTQAADLAANDAEIFTAEIYQEYQRILETNNAMDFDDLITQTTRLFAENPNIRGKYRHIFRHILVDEFQDTNYAQYRLIEDLGLDHKDVFIVGDEDQSIYGWRGADYKHLKHFIKAFSATTIMLEHNYRSTQVILDVAMDIINEQKDRHEKHLVTDRRTGQKVIMVEAENEYQEAAMIGAEIQKLTGRMGRKPSDIAVMYRTNAQSRVIEEEMLQRGIPYRLVGGVKFYARKEIKDVLSYARAAYNHEDNTSFERIINTPTRGIGEKAQEAIWAAAQKHSMSVLSFLLATLDGTISPADSGLPLKLLLNGQKVARLFAKWDNDKEDPAQLIQAILKDTDYPANLLDGTPQGDAKIENLEELQRLATEYATEGTALFLEHITLVSAQDDIPASANVPILMTLHAAKGLEFPVVFLAGLDEGTLPHKRSIRDEEGLAEERRLLYVGMTRAQDLLYLVYPACRVGGSQDDSFEGRCRFLDNISEAKLEHRHLSPAASHSTARHGNRFGQPAARVGFRYH